MNRTLRIAALALLLASPVRAMMLDIPLSQNAGESDAVVRGTVVTRTSHWAESGPRIIVTDITVKLSESWKGTLAAGQEVTFQVNGGEVDGMGMRQEHQPVFIDEEDVVLFLKATPSAHWSVSYDEQGKFAVRDDQVVGSKGDAGKLGTFRTSVKQMIQASAKRTH
jgi:hypothetical protein